MRELRDRVHPAAPSAASTPNAAARRARKAETRARTQSITRRSGLAALILTPIAVATVMLSQPSESPAERFNGPLVAVPPAPSGDLEAALPASSALVPDRINAVALEAETATAAHAVVIEVAPGDTLMALLTREGVNRTDAHEAVTALSNVFSPKGLRPGQQIRLTFLPGEEIWAAAGEEAEPPQLASLMIQPSVDKTVQVLLDEQGGYQAASSDRPLELEVQGERGVIDDSLYASAVAAGVPVPTLVEMIRLFSYDVDFQREIQPGDGFEVLYEAYYDENGERAKTGRILFASLTLSGKPLELYAFTPKSGFEDFFDSKGQSVRKALLKTPVDGARISSGFGMRKHPILGYSKMHKGVDFAVPTGTPIYAAGDGVVEMAGWNGGYGKYVRLKHNGTYMTAYGHMSKIAAGLGKGDRVKQGEVIGYVGTTGQSTGPHLHYEILVGGKQVNPLGVKLPSGETLAGKDLEDFKALVAEVDKLRATSVKVAVPQIAETPSQASDAN